MLLVSDVANLNRSFGRRISRDSSARCQPRFGHRETAGHGVRWFSAPCDESIQDREREREGGETQLGITPLLKPARKPTMTPRTMPMTTRGVSMPRTSSPLAALFLPLSLSPLPCSFPRFSALRSFRNLYGIPAGRDWTAEGIIGKERRGCEGDGGRAGKGPRAVGPVALGRRARGIRRSRGERGECYRRISERTLARYRRR